MQTISNGFTTFTLPEKEYVYVRPYGSKFKATYVFAMSGRRITKIISAEQLAALKQDESYLVIGSKGK